PRKPPAPPPAILARTASDFTIPARLAARREPRAAARSAMRALPGAVPRPEEAQPDRADEQPGREEDEDGLSEGGAPAGAEDEVVHPLHRPGRVDDRRERLHPLGLDRLRPPEAPEPREHHDERETQRLRLFTALRDARDEEADGDRREHDREAQDEERDRRR